VLRATWIQQFYLDSGQVRWRDKHSGLPPGKLLILNPYDLDARPGVKRGRNWRGYKAHFTETCEPDRPHLITHVATTDPGHRRPGHHAEAATPTSPPMICCPTSTWSTRATSAWGRSWPPTMTTASS
jgi:hypothetical protein